MSNPSIKAAHYLTDITPDAGITMILPGTSHDPGPVTIPSGTLGLRAGLALDELDRLGVRQ